MGTKELRARALDLFDYSSELGVFKYREASRGNRKGAIAGTTRKNGYRQLVIDGRTYFEHRIAWLMEKGFLPEFMDHINGDKVDNRIANLRPATSRENQQNRIEHRRGDCKPGAHFIKATRARPWRGLIGVNGKKVHLGYFRTEDEAHKAYLDACERVANG